MIVIFNSFWKAKTDLGSRLLGSRLLEDFKMATYFTYENDDNAYESEDLAPAVTFTLDNCH